MCPSRWLTPANGTPRATAIALAAAIPSFASSVPAAGGHAVHDVVQPPTVVLGSNVVGPHDQRILAGLLVVVLADPHGAKSEPRIQALGAVVRDPDLQRHGRGAHAN